MFLSYRWRSGGGEPVSNHHFFIGVHDAYCQVIVLAPQPQSVMVRAAQYQLIVSALVIDNGVYSITTSERKYVVAPPAG